MVEWIPAACKRHATPPPLIRVDTTYTLLLLHSDPGKRKSQPSPRSGTISGNEGAVSAVSEENTLKLQVSQALRCA